MRRAIGRLLWWFLRAPGANDLARAATWARDSGLWENDGRARMERAADAAPKRAAKKARARPPQPRPGRR